MKHIDVLNSVLNGSNYRFGIYVGSKAELGKMRVEGGTPRTFPLLTHTVMCGNQVLPVKEKVEDSFRPESYKPPFNFGTKIVIEVESYTKDKAFNSICYGRLIALDDAPPVLTVAK